MTKSKIPMSNIESIPKTPMTKKYDLKERAFSRHCEERQRRSNPVINQRLLRFARNDGVCTPPGFLTMNCLTKTALSAFTAALLLGSSVLTLKGKR